MNGTGESNPERWATLESQIPRDLASSEILIPRGMSNTECQIQRVGAHRESNPDRWQREVESREVCGSMYWFVSFETVFPSNVVNEYLRHMLEEKIFNLKCTEV